MDYVRAAIFVDFDNVFISMDQVNRRGAELFASRPHKWLSWFERGQHDESADERPRRLLVRRCYLNPIGFGKYRSYFTRAAFSVVDCPPLTARGKNSADIYMAIDIVDALRHENRIDEFILLSADADFTPVLLRLREHDRRTTILTNEQTAAAYRAACDHAVEQDAFFARALGVLEDDDATLAQADHHEGIAHAVNIVIDELRRRPLVGAAELPRLLGRIQGFRGSNWFGAFSLRSLAERIVELHPQLRLAGDPARAWWIERSDDSPHADTPPADHERNELAERILDYVAERIADSEAPIPAAKLAQEVLQAWPAARTTDWAGHGSFGALIQAGDHPTLRMSREPPSHVYDETRHRIEEEADRLRTLEPELANLIERIASVTDVPRLTPEEYAFIFQAIQDLTREGIFDLAQLSRMIRDQAVDRSLPLGRQPINFVLKGLVYSRVELADPGLTKEGLAATFLENVMSLCENRRLELTHEEEAMVARWITGQASAAPETDMRDEPTAPPGPAAPPS